MKIQKVLTYLDDNNMPYIVKEETAYHVDGRRKNDTPDLVYDLLKCMRLPERATEAVMLLMFDAACHLICVNEVSTGTIDRSLVGPREIAQTMLLCGAKRCVLAHNHPSGDPTPSHADIQITEQVANALKLLQLELLDHLVIGKYGYISLKEMGYMTQ